MGFRGEKIILNIQRFRVVDHGISWALRRNYIYTMQ